MSASAPAPANGAPNMLDFVSRDSGAATSAAESEAIR
jgi:hypothetical protein